MREVPQRPPRLQDATSAPAPAGPKALDPTPPVLSLFRHGNIAVLRIHDLSFSGVVSAVVQSLPAGVTSLMLVTPTDTKMFQITGKGATHVDTSRKQVSYSQAGDDEASLGEVEEASGGEEFEDDPQARAIAEAERDESESAGVEASPIADHSNREAVREFRRATAVPASDPCQRCGGSGKIALALPDGGATEAPCGVCRGAGVIRRFGVRR